MDDPRLCRCGCGALSRQAAFLRDAYRRRMRALIFAQANSPSSLVRREMAEMVAILSYLEAAGDKAPDHG